MYLFPETAKAKAMLCLDWQSMCVTRLEFVTRVGCARVGSVRVRCVRVGCVMVGWVGVGCVGEGGCVCLCLRVCVGGGCVCVKKIRYS